MRKILEKREKGLVGFVIPSWIPGEHLPIISGKVGGLYDAEETDFFVNDWFIEDEDERPCHDVRISILGEKDGSYAVVIVGPSETKVAVDYRGEA